MRSDRMGHMCLCKTRTHHTKCTPPTFRPPQLVCLLDAAMGHAEKAILRAKFKPIAGVLTTLLKTNLDHEMTGACHVMAARQRSGSASHALAPLTTQTRSRLHSHACMM